MKYTRITPGFLDLPNMKSLCKTLIVRNMLLIFKITPGFLDVLKSLHKTLSVRGIPKLRRLSVQDDNGEYTFSKMNMVVRLAIVLEPEEQVLNLSKLGGSSGYSLPDSIFSLESLRELRTRNCIFAPKGWLSCVALKVLQMEFGGLVDIEDVLLDCPTLESLILHNVCLYGRMHIVHKKLKKLVIDHSRGEDAKDKLEIHVKVCQPEELELLAAFVGIQCKLIDVPSLVHAHLDFSEWSF